MQLMALNALLLFDAIFIFFLFLVSVSCLLYYLPLVPPSRSNRLLLANLSSSDIESALGASSLADGLILDSPPHPATHIVAPEHTTKSKKKKGKDLPPIETV